MNTQLTHKSRPRIGFLHPGSFYHLACLRDPAIQAMDLVDLYAPELEASDLASLDALFVACRQHPRVMARNAPLVVDFLGRVGKRCVIGGENRVATWLPGASESPRETNFWAWRTGEDTTRRLSGRGDPLWNFLDASSVDWHHHGALTVPQGATSLMSLEEGTSPPKSIIYHDSVSFPSELVVMTMDPTYHHGCGFMPGATQLLYRLLSWLGSRD